MAVPARSPKPMSESELKALLDAKVTNSLGFYGGKLAEARVEALQYYNGEPFGNEMDGRSQVVSRDVAEAVDSMMPSLMKVFTSGEEVVRFNAQRPEDEAIADQATDYVNWVVMTQNDGFRIVHDWFKDALLNRTACVKSWWDTQDETRREKYSGLTDEQFEILLKEAPDETLEVIEHTEYPDPAPTPAVMAAMGALLPSPVSPPAQLQPAIGGMPGSGLIPAGSPQAPVAPPLVPRVGPPSPAGVMDTAPPPPVEPPPLPMLHDVTLRRTNKVGRVRILPIPGEEFLMDRRAVSLEDTPFCAHRQRKTVSDLVEMGFDYDVVSKLGDDQDGDFNSERLERFRQEDEAPYREGDNFDPAMRSVWVVEAYIKVDFDGDGIAELRKITFAGDGAEMAILDNDETDDHPFSGITPIPMPHKFYGMSIADQTMDLQLIKSTLLRIVLDHGYSALMPQLGVIEGQVNLDDLLTRRPGGIVRMKTADAIIPMPAAQMGVDPFQMISYIDSVREQRTGVQRFTAGPGADSLNNAYTDTATGANIVENSTQERIELIARCFAELGMKPLARKVLKLLSMHQDKEKVIRLRGKWVTMDPREWETEFDTTVTVGLGTGNRAQQLQGMTSLLNIDRALVMQQGGLHGPLVTAENLYNKLNKLCQYIGLKSAESYYTDPSAEGASAPPPPKPDPAVQAAQIRAQADQAKQQADLQADAQKFQAQTVIDQQKSVRDAQFDQQKLQLQMQADRDKTALTLESQERIAATKIMAEREVQYARIAAEREEFNAQAHLETMRHSTETALKARQMESADAGREQDHDFRQRTTPGAIPAPKVARVTLVKGAGGFATQARRHYDDGSEDAIHIDRLTDMPGPEA